MRLFSVMFFRCRFFAQLFKNWNRVIHILPKWSHSSVFINEPKVLHKTEVVTWFLTAVNFLFCSLASYYCFIQWIDTANHELEMKFSHVNRKFSFSKSIRNIFRKLWTLLHQLLVHCIVHFQNPLQSKWKIRQIFQ